MSARFFLRLSRTAALVACLAATGACHASQKPKDTCQVTQPNGVVAGSSERQDGSYGNARVSVGPFGLWPNGTIVFKPGGPGFVTRDGGLGMKFGWTRGVSGVLHITGRRLDAPAAPLQSEVGDDAGGGFEASYLIFPSPGCWEVTATIGDRSDASLTFVTRVEQVGAGPSWHRDSAP
jgi:hypothetical protein